MSSRHLLASKLKENLIFSLALAMYFIIDAPKIFAETQSELMGMSLEKLMNMETLIVSASKTDQKVSDSSAAVFVIGKEDIRRSGSNHIADLLKMVPGILSVKNSSSEWAVAPRGFAGKFAGDVLVMIDGRSVFASLQNSVAWDEQNIAVEDIERIEVIRGPGGSLWGANAVNGVINIITKNPDQLEGARISVSTGVGDKSTIYFSYGGAFGKTGNVSLSAYQSKREGYESQDFDLEERDWDTSRIRLGATWELGDNVFDVSAEDYKITSYPFWPQYIPAEPYIIFNEPREVRDGYALQTKWTRILSDTSGLDTRVSIDDITRRSTNFAWDTNNIDLDIEWHNEFTNGHQLVIGFNSRATESRWETFELLDIDVTPAEIDTSVYSAFLQYTHFLTNNLRVTGGAKVEEHSEAGQTIQPTLRALWSISDTHRLWGALSKSEATSSRLEYSPAVVEVGVFPASAGTGGLPIIILFDNDGSKIDNRELISAQLGYRYTPTASFNIDIASFYNDYKNRSNISEVTENTIVFTNIPGIGDIPFYIETRTFPENNGKATTHGFEVAASLQTSEQWHIQYSGTYLNINDEELGASSLDTIDGSRISRSAPKSWHSLRSLYNFSEDVELDLWFRYTDEIEFSTVDSYLTLDIRLGWRINENIDLSLNARNLIDDKHVEYHREAFMVDRFIVEESYSLKLDILF